MTLGNMRVALADAEAGRPQNAAAAN